MSVVHHFHWTSSVKCPNHHEAVNVFVDQPVAPGGSHIEITGCCSEFTGMVERKLRSVVKASFHTSIFHPSETGLTDWLSKLPRREA